MSLVALVSCVQEANDGSQRLNGTIADLSGQVASVSVSLEQLNALQNVVEQDLSELSADLEAHIGYLKSGVSRMDGTMATLQLQKQVAMVVAELQAAGFESSLTQFVKSVKSWLGKSFETYFDVLVYGCTSQALVEGAALQLSEQHSYVDAVLSDVEAGLRDGVAAEELASVLETLVKNLASATELTSQVDEIVLDLETECAMAVEALFDESSSYDATALKKAATQARIQLKSSEVTFNTLTSSINELTTRIGAIEGKLTEIESTVEELLGMIQSVTFMSEYTDEYAYALYDMDLNTKIDDSNLSYNGKAKRTATGTMNLTYMVRPAAAAKALNANLDAVDVIGYYAKSAVATRAPLASDYIDFTVTKVAVVNEDRGLLTVTVEPKLRESFYYKEIGAKCALSINNGKSDVTSKFVEILPKENSTRVYVQSVIPSKEMIIIKQGETAELTATINPEGVSTLGYYLTSTDTKYVRIDESGLVSGFAEGTATVEIWSKGTDEWGLPIKATCTVKVEAAFVVDGPPFVEVGYDAQMFLTYPTDAIVKTKEWSTSDGSKLTVDENGKVHGIAHTYNVATKSYGEIMVYCHINDLYKPSAKIKVAAVQPQDIKTPAIPEGQSEVVMKVDERLSLASTIYPENVPEGAYVVKYMSDPDGLIDFRTGVINEYNITLSPQTVYVYLIADNYDQEKYLTTDPLKKTVIVKIQPYYVTSITMEDVKLQPNQSAVLTPTFTSDVDGKAPTITKLTWESDNPSIATVDENGNVTALEEGNVIITATATDGSGVKGTCNVNVTRPWKEFETGDYVVRKSNGEIAFFSSATDARNNGTVVGIVIAKVNPRVSDAMLPEDCTHGIAMGLKHSATGTKAVSTTAPSSEPYSLYKYAMLYPGEGYVSSTGVKYVSGTTYDRNDIGKKPYGYNNTLLLKAFLGVHTAITSGLNDNLINYNRSNTKPLETSDWYLPSIYEMWMVYECFVNNSLNTKLSAVDGDQLQNANFYWTVSEIDGNATSNFAGIRAMVGLIQPKLKTNTDLYTRYFFAF